MEKPEDVADAGWNGDAEGANPVGLGTNGDIVGWGAGLNEGLKPVGWLVKNEGVGPAFGRPVAGAVPGRVGTNELKPVVVGINGFSNPSF